MSGALPDVTGGSRLNSILIFKPMIDSPSKPITETSPAPQKGASRRPRGSRLDQSLRGAGRAAIKRGDEVVHVHASIRVGKSVTVSGSVAGRPEAMLLDPELVQLSRWANRHEQSYLSDAFLELKRSIQHDGGNQVPILVRPLHSSAEPSSSPPYELVYGHRRLRACRELGLPVRAIVEDLADVRLVERMHAENRERESLSAYETGQFYKRLLDEGLYASQRKLADALGVDQSDVSRKVWLASLPADVIQLFQSPIDVSCDDVKRLQPTWNRDPGELHAHARALLDTEGPLPAKQVIAKLTGGAGAVPKSDGATITQDKAVVEIRDAGSHGTTIRVNVRLRADEQRDLRSQIEAFLSTCAGHPAEAPVGKKGPL